MLQHAALAPDLAAYLRATRSEASERTRYSTDELLTFFDDVVGSFELSGLPLHHVSLSIVDSARIDIETVLSSGRAHVIFDQSLYDALRLLVQALFTEFDGHIGWAASPHRPGAVPQWLHALFANRYLAEGLGEEALIHAMSSWAAKPDEAALAHLDERRVDRWLRVQAAFAVAHEIGHCPLKAGGSEILARSVAQSFDEDMRPLAAHWDAQKGNPEATEGLVDELMRRQNTDWLAEVERRHEDLLRVRAHLKKHSEEHAEELPELDMPDPDGFFADMSFQDELDWLLARDTGIGEEVLADYMALSFTARIVGDRILPYDECLAAGVIAIHALGLLRTVEVLCRSYTPARHDPAQVAELIQEHGIRQRFAALSALVLSGKQHLRELDEASAEATHDALDRRSRALAYHLNRLAHVWTTRVWGRLFDRPIGFTEMLRAELSTQEEFRAAVQSNSLPGLVAEQTGIGPVRFDPESEREP